LELWDKVPLNLTSKFFFTFFLFQLSKPIYLLLLLLLWLLYCGIFLKNIQKKFIFKGNFMFYFTQKNGVDIDFSVKVQSCLGVGKGQGYGQKYFFVFEKLGGGLLRVLSSTILGNGIKIHIKGEFDPQVLWLGWCWSRMESGVSNHM